MLVVPRRVARNLGRTQQGRGYAVKERSLSAAEAGQDVRLVTRAWHDRHTTGINRAALPASQHRLGAAHGIEPEDGPLVSAGAWVRTIRVDRVRVSDNELTVSVHRDPHWSNQVPTLGY